MNYLTVFVLIFSAQGVLSRKLPSFINYCHRDLPKDELLNCFRTAVETIRPHLANGITDFLIPPMNPLVLPEAGLDSGDNFKANFKNIEIFYADSFIIKNLDVDLNPLKVDLSVDFPKMRIKSEYDIDGKILILQLKGSGPADGNFTDISARLMLKGSLYEKNGKQYFKIDEKKLDMDLGKPVFKFEGIFRDNRELNDQTNKIINENIVDIMEELNPVIKDTVQNFVFGLVERIYKRFSYDELFPK